MTIIGFETGTRYVPPPPPQAWRLAPEGALEGVPLPSAGWPGTPWATLRQAWEGDLGAVAAARREAAQAAERRRRAARTVRTMMAA